MKVIKMSGYVGVAKVERIDQEKCMLTLDPFSVGSTTGYETEPQKPIQTEALQDYALEKGTLAEK